MPLGDGPPFYVNALCVVPGPNADLLYAGAASVSPTPNIGERQLFAVWDGNSWTNVESAILMQSVDALAYFDDGTGAALYAAGIGGVYRRRNDTWEDVSDGADFVEDFAIYDAGSGPRLYAGRSYFARLIIRWNGTRWVKVGDPPDNTDFAWDLCVHDAGDGAKLYAAAGVRGVIRLDADGWTRIGPATSGGSVTAVTVANLGDGEKLYAAGPFTRPSAPSIQGVAVWDGDSWSPVGTDPHAWTYALSPVTISGQPALFAGGYYMYNYAGEALVNNVAFWNGVEWSSAAPTTQPGGGVNEAIDASVVFDDGSGPALYVAGHFTHAGAVPASNIVRWDGQVWQALGGGLNDRVRRLCVYDDGNGPSLYAGGDFTQSGELELNHIACWDGAAWHDVGGGRNPDVLAMTVFDDGTGPALFAGGNYFPSRVWKWDGDVWNAYGNLAGSSIISDLAVYDDGAGEALYASLRTSDATALKRWTGETWADIPDSPFNGAHWAIFDMEVFDDATGPALCLGGFFYLDLPNGDRADHIIRWNGQTWDAVGLGADNYQVHTLIAFNDQPDPVLFAADSYALYRLQNQSWTKSAPAVDGVTGITRFDDQAGPALYFTGGFTQADGVYSSKIARWGCDAAAADCDGSGVVEMEDLGILLAAFDECDTQPGFDERADVDGDGCITLTDLARLLRYFGEDCSI